MPIGSAQIHALKHYQDNSDVQRRLDEMWRSDVLHVEAMARHELCFDGVGSPSACDRQLQGFGFFDGQTGLIGSLFCTALSGAHINDWSLLLAQ